MQRPKPTRPLGRGDFKAAFARLLKAAAAESGDKRLMVWVAKLVAPPKTRRPTK